MNNPGVQTQVTISGVHAALADISTVRMMHSVGECVNAMVRAVTILMMSRGIEPDREEAMNIVSGIIITSGARRHAAKSLEQSLGAWTPDDEADLWEVFASWVVGERAANRKQQSGPKLVTP